MAFGSSNKEKKDPSKAWRDIWGCGQGIGVITEVESAGAVVDRLANEYAAAKSLLQAQ